LALELIRNSGVGNDQPKATAYLFVAQQLAEKHNFDGALQVARLIRNEPTFPGQMNVFVTALLRIQSKQAEAGDSSGVKNTLTEALEAAEQETANSSTPEFAVTRAGLYAGIAGELDREGDRETALSVVERIYALIAAAEPASSQDLLLLLATAQASIGEFESALSSAGQLSPGPKRDGILLTVSMERIRRGDPLAALDEASSFSLEGWRNSSLRGIVGALSDSGDYVRALATIDLIREPAERAYGLADLALEQAEKQNAFAAQTVELALEAALAAGAETKPYVFEVIAVTRAVLGDFVRAEEMISQMDDEARVWPLWNMTEMLVHAGNEEEAIALAENQSGAYPKVYALLGTATALIDKQQESLEKAELTAGR
jgi:tetratricopeptide (TPR) repeat protein